VTTSAYHSSNRALSVVFDIDLPVYAATFLRASAPVKPGYAPSVMGCGLPPRVRRKTHDLPPVLRMRS